MNNIEEAITDIRQGKMIIVVDDEDRENEGDLIMAAEKVSPQSVNFMINEGKGLVCVPLEENRINKLDLPPMVNNNTDTYETAFTVSVDYKETSTGISAGERSMTIKELVNSNSEAGDFKRPGHIFPLRAKKGGVLRRAGHTEAAVDITK